jgi:hypothetical protein
MARVQMSWAGPLKDLRVGILIIALGHLLDDVDGIIHYWVVGLPPPKVILPTVITIVIAAVVVIVAPIVVAAIWLVGARSPANVLLDLLVSLISVYPLLRHREKVPNRVRPLAEKFGPESIMVAEASNKCGDGFIAVDVRDGYPCFREATDLVMQWFIRIVSYFLQIILLPGC